MRYPHPWQVEVRFQVMFEESHFDDSAARDVDTTMMSGGDVGRRFTLAPPPQGTRAPVTPMQGSALHAINYDYAMAFPRTLADSGVRQQKKSIVERFLIFPLWSLKEE